MRLLIMGPPGAGKGTQAVALAQRIGGAHISTGDIFRANVRDQTELGQIAQRYMDAGEYVPDEVTNAMVKDRLAQDDARESFLLDGYPRTVDQVHKLDQILDELGNGLDGVIELVVDPEELIQRLLKRAETSGRADDTEDVIRHRQEVYTAETAPLLEIYGSRGLLIQVDGVGDVDEVTRRIDAALPSS
ncbi:adenylate kinase [Aeromicrobium wangtongii]|uniref:Adenylate kinase n=1 Tax=Aeromicrobium wangtongii TaxID=2969247 RepID=A0ABY5M7Q0_9ACTN|nr:adenylate kinase [Aeromicrobium wangtongii]MCD9198804.1 adenylate kinase [Aeromicrobium wangtongii]MCL3819714.1 adenylate kinase [Aeromicrobium wangtongii]UUP13156.1 adenylate kinase [Aeromicrobium wangtongii]